MGSEMCIRDRPYDLARAGQIGCESRLAKAGANAGKTNGRTTRLVRDDIVREGGSRQGFRFTWFAESLDDFRYASFLVSAKRYFLKIHA